MKAIANESDALKKQELISRANKDKEAAKAADKQAAAPTTPDQVSRDGEVIPGETSFTNILNGPKVSADKLIKTNTP